MSFAMKRSTPGLLFAEKLYDFLTKTVKNNTLVVNDVQALFSRWSYDFDRFLMDKDVDRVKSVFDYYVQSYRSGKITSVFNSPYSFSLNYLWLEKSYLKNHLPIQKEKLKKILATPQLQNWSGDKDELVAVISQSVYNIKVMLKSLSKAKISDNAKAGIRGGIGYVDDFVSAHVTEKVIEQEGRIPNARYFLLSGSDVARSFLSDLGYSGYDINAYVKEINRVIDEYNRNRPRN